MPNLIPSKDQTANVTVTIAAIVTAAMVTAAT